MNTNNRIVLSCEVARDTAMSKWAALGAALATAAAAGIAALIAQKLEEEQECELRAGLDIGSGSMKMVIAKVNKRTLKIKTVISAEYVELLLAHNLSQSPDNTLSESILLEATAIMRHFLRECDAAHVPRHRIRGVATQVQPLALPAVMFMLAC